MTNKQFNYKYILCSLILFLIFFLFNFIIDPYGYNNKFQIKNFNANKTQTEAQSRKFKINLAQKQEFNALFLGSSEMTFLGNTQYASELTNLKFFNLAFNEQEIYESLEYLKYIISQKEIKHVILGLHPFKFSKHYDNYRQDTPANIIKGKGNIETYLSYQTFFDSLKTIYKNYNDFPLIHDKNGWKVVNRLKYYNVPQEQYHQWLKNKVEDAPHILANEAKIFKLDMNKINYLYEIIDLCKKKQITLKLFFTPMYYKHYLTIYSQLENEINHLKQLIAYKAPFYDFSTINYITLDYTNFLDRVSHSRQKVSFPMLDTLINEKYHKDFGYYITTQNINEFIKLRKDELQHYHK